MLRRPGCVRGVITTVLHSTARRESDLVSLQTTAVCFFSVSGDVAMTTRQLVGWFGWLVGWLVGGSSGCRGGSAGLGCAGLRHQYASDEAPLRQISDAKNRGAKKQQVL